jgi:hypothetical protein
MKKFVVVAASAALLAGVSLSTLAAEKSMEDMCKERATKEKVSADKMDAYVKSCMARHSHSSMSGMSGEKGSQPPK